MREIKFRAWYAGAFVYFDFAKMKEWQYFGYRTLAPADAVYQQYTGLKDKNGVDIFEGDIVREERGINEVKFEAYDSFQGYFLNTDDWSLEVIGNIYEHPHLLTEH